MAFYKGKIILIDDGAPYHGSNVVKDFKSANVARLTIERLPAFMKYFKTFEDLHDSVITTFKMYLQDASKVLCVMKKMREDFAITA